MTAPSTRTGLLGVQHLTAPPFRWAVPPIAAGVSALLIVLQPLVARIIGVASWGGCFCGGRTDAWPIGLTVMVWHSALAVVIGAYVARRILQRTDRSWLELLKALFSAAGGTVFAIPFIAALAGQATVANVPSPGLQMALIVPSGALLGVVLGLLVLRKPVLLIPLWVHIGWIWLLGFVSVVLSWGDDVRQSVPLGAAYVGGPGGGAQPIERTTYDVTLSALKLLAFFGPIVAAGMLAWLAIRAGHRSSTAWVSGLLGPGVVLASYLVRPDTITGDNSEWYSLGIRVMVLAVIATAATCLFASVLRRRPTPQPAGGPVVNVKITPES